MIIFIDARIHLNQQKKKLKMLKWGKSLTE